MATSPRRIKDLFSLVFLKISQTALVAERFGQFGKTWKMPAKIDP